MHEASRRDFLANLGHGALLAWAGGSLAGELTASPRGIVNMPPRSRDQVFGSDLEVLIATMQETAPDALMGKLVGELRAGTTLDTLVAAGAIANARAFAGMDYDGYHAQMALLPARHMAKLMAAKLTALPVLKVLHRSTARIQATGGARNRLEAVTAKAVASEAGAELLRSTRKGEMRQSEELFQAICNDGTKAAFDHLHPLIRDEHNVHRIVLAWRSWDMLPVVGEEHGHALLHQYVRFCVDHEQQRLRKGRPEPAIRKVVPKLLDQHKVLARGMGQRQPDDAFVEELSKVVFRSSRERAADAVAAALAEGFDPEALGEAISLAANLLLLHDTGSKRVHGASVGVHASDAANAWRHLARLGSPANRLSNMVAAAYHTGGQSQQVGKLPYAFDEQLQELQAGTPAESPLNALERAIESRDQRSACAAAQRYGDLALPAAAIFDLLLGYACSEDGALHAEKYFHTVREEYRNTRPALRWRRVVALARVTASEFGQRAPGYDIARELLED